MSEGDAVAAHDEASWDAEFDFVVAGSGGGGMTAALAADDSGASVLVLEKQALIGGSTCMSGGVVWIPNNPLMQRGGVADSYDDAMTHFEAVVGDVGPASSKERRDAFLTAGPEMVEFLERCGLQFARCDGYSDYYSNLPGGKDIGRAIEPMPWNGKALGSWLPKLQPGLAQSVGLSVMTNESRSLSHYNRSPHCFAVAARVVIRTYGAKARRQALLTNGASLIGQMLRAALDRNIPVWTEAPLDDLVVEDGRVVGVRTVRDGKPVAIRARHGVLISAGGFAHNPEMREEYSGDQPNKARWSIANPGDTGEALLTAMRLGAATDLMDEAWWLPNPRTGRFGQSTLDQARQRPRTMMVDAAGNRFVNESNSYMEVGKAMYARDKSSKAVPAWLIFDDRYRKRYAHQRSQPGHFPKKLLQSGNLKQAWTLADLANMCGIDPDRAGGDRRALQRARPRRRRPRLRARRVRLQPVARRSATRAAPVSRAARRGALLRGADAAVRHRHVRRTGHRRGRPRARRLGCADRRPVRDREQHGDGDGPALPRPRRQHRQQHGVRLPRRPPGSGRSSGRGSGRGNALIRSGSGSAPRWGMRYGGTLLLQP